jgi:hypothetical protein
METPALPEDLVYSRCARLLAVQHAVAEIAGGRKVDADPEALKEAVALTRKAVRLVPGAYACFIGGLAVQEHGYVRWTNVVDVVVDAQHYGEVLEKMREFGFAITTDWSLQHRETGARIDLLKEGTTLHNSQYPLPHPRELGKNCGFAAIEAIVRMKLDTGGRLKDLADIVELLKVHPEQMDLIELKLPEPMRAQYVQLLAQARRELGL